MPSPLFGLGFFKLDLRGDLATDEEAMVDPLEPNAVEAVATDIVLPLVGER